MAGMRQSRHLAAYGFGGGWPCSGLVCLPGAAAWRLMSALPHVGRLLGGGSSRLAPVRARWRLKVRGG